MRCDDTIVNSARARLATVLGILTGNHISEDMFDESLHALQEAERELEEARVEEIAAEKKRQARRKKGVHDRVL